MKCYILKVMYCDSEDYYVYRNVEGAMSRMGTEHSAYKCAIYEIDWFKEDFRVFNDCIAPYVAELLIASRNNHAPSKISKNAISKLIDLYINARGAGYIGTEHARVTRYQNIA